MGMINKKNIDTLINHYNGFVDAVKYRKDLSFYSQSNKIIELSYNENPLGASKYAIDILKEKSQYAHLYPPIGYVSFYEKLSNFLGVKELNVIIAPGSVAVIQLAIFQYANRDDEVIFSKSSMPWYKWSTIGNNSIPIEVPLMADMNHDLDRILETINNKTKVIILSNPHNPTGLYIEEKTILDFIKQVPKNVLVIIDQAYYEYTHKEEKILINQINEFPNLLLTRTFSKIYGLAGLRIGYGMANKTIIESLKAKWLGSMPSITSLAVFAASASIDDDEHRKKSKDFVDKVKNDFYKLFEKYDVPYLHSEANFITFNVKDSQKYHHLFREHNIELTPGYFFGYEEWVRTSFVKDSELQFERTQQIIKLIYGK